VNAASILRSRTLASVALGLVGLLVVAGVQQGTARALDVESTVLAPIAIAVVLVGIVVLAGRSASGWRRTPYW